MNFNLKQYLGNKKILVVGLGYSNVALIRYLVSLGIVNIEVTDSMHDQDELEKIKQNIEKVRAFLPECRFILGSHDSLTLSEYDIVIKSPSIEDSKPFITEIKRLKIPIETDISLFFKLIPREKIIGITGTKGKSTTTSLVWSVLKDQGIKATISGNIGIPVFDSIQEHMAAEYVIVELSSFMNVSLTNYRLSPARLIITSLNQDHLDFHGTVSRYVADKMSIVFNQKATDSTYINVDSEFLKQFFQHRKLSHIHRYSGKDVDTWITTKLRGKHYLANIAAAYNVSKDLLGKRFDKKCFIETVKNFNPLVSRMETIAKIGDVEYINNSKATNTDAFCADLLTLIDEKKSIFVLCGGEDKGLDLSFMVNLLESEYVKGVYVFDNVGGKRLANQLGPQKIKGYYRNVPTAFHAAVEQAYQIHEGNKVIILMPGTGTYGLFKNKDGADAFNKCVQEMTK